MIGYSVVNASMEEGTLDIFKIDGERWYETRSSENVQAVGTWHSGGEEVLISRDEEAAEDGSGGVTRGSFV
jgi:hypothetical protein